MSTAEPSLLVERQGAVALVMLNEPKSLNALSPTMKAAMAETMPVLARDAEVRAIVITGGGRAFCAGGDIRSMVGITAEKARARMEETYSWLLPLLRANKPVICAVNSVAAGAGLSLALCGDIVMASEDVLFKAGFPGVGLVPDLALAHVLPRAIGVIRARDMLLTNREVRGPEALAMGLVSRLVPGERLREEALALAHQLAEGPTFAFGLMKQLTGKAFDTGLEAFLSEEGAMQALAFLSEDFAEGRNAFLAKRKPQFKGR